MMPISEALVERIRVWQEWFDREEGNAPITAGYTWDIEPFGADGLAITQVIKTELPDRIVVYHDIRRWPAERREMWEYRFRRTLRPA